MHEDNTKTKMKPERKQNSYLNYTVGYVLSVVCTLLAYSIVAGHLLTGIAAVAVVVSLAVAQLVVQLIFFLHLGREGKPRWNLMAFLFMIMVLFIIVAGSLWIMQNLNYNMMSPEQMNKYMMEQNKSGF